MATLQVKRVPDDLYAAAKARAASEGITLSDLVLRMLREELSLPSMSEWLAENRKAREGLPPVQHDVEALMDEVRGEIEDR